jgi:hypothetical protein
MFRPVTEITITQVQKATDDPNNPRNKVFFFNFCNQFSVNTSWVDITNDVKIIFPKNVYVKDKDGISQPLGGIQSSVQVNDLFQRGDKIMIKYGYLETTPQPNLIFEGFISKVTSKKPIQLECEDSMWILKQTPFNPTSNGNPIKALSASTAIQTYLAPILATKGLTVDTKALMYAGNLLIENETVAQFLMRLRKEFHIESFFVGTKLIIGFDPYLSITPNPEVYKFTFQKNIISDDLDWQRKDDVKLSAVVQCINTSFGGYNKKGEVKTKKEHLSVLVSNLGDKWVSQVKVKGVELPENQEGERRTLFFPSTLDEQALALLPEAEKQAYLKTHTVTTDTLIALGIATLQKYYYTGFKGKFTTFAHPLVKIGDSIYIQDVRMPDRNGYYNVKAVEYTGGVNGHRQIITLDYQLISTIKKTPK